MAPTHALYDVDPSIITLCKRGANRQRIFLRKEHVEPTVATAPKPILKAGGEDWSAFYIVVAEPGAEEDGGIGAEDLVDVWKSEDEIRAAAHRFITNNGRVNLLHGSDPVDGARVVESAVALADLEVGASHKIAKGSWYVAIQPDDDLKAAIDAGDIEGVSIEGTGMREPLAKASYEGAKKCPGCSSKVAQDASKCPNCEHSFSVAKATPDTPIPNKPGKTNWVERAGGLPRKIREVAEDILTKRPGDVSGAIRLAVGIVRNWAHGHDGKGHKVSAKTQAEAVAAIAEWDRKRASSKIAKETSDEAAIAAAVEESSELAPLLEESESSLLHRIADHLFKSDAGLTDDERAALERAASSLDRKPDPEEDDVSQIDEERFTKLEKAVEDSTSSMNKLIDLVGDLTKKVQERKPDDEGDKPTSESIKKTLEDFGSEVTSKLDSLAADVDALASGQSVQEVAVQKSNGKASDENPLAGLLD